MNHRRTVSARRPQMVSALLSLCAAAAVVSGALVSDAGLWPAAHAGNGSVTSASGSAPNGTVIDPSVIDPSVIDQSVVNPSVIDPNWNNTGN
ncbi:hypothetical protein ABZZ17_03830 [Streptomyces sp. NPDC006512]|uniref:hypothetical protein n=1 Tax=Streptomyces sp. NPDC006512 TaxID=3154307 RepID=UPI0033B5B024